MNGLTVSFPFLRPGGAVSPGLFLLELGLRGWRDSLSARALASLVSASADQGLDRVLRWVEEDTGLLSVATERPLFMTKLVFKMAQYCACGICLAEDRRHRCGRCQARIDADVWESERDLRPWNEEE